MYKDILCNCMSHPSTFTISYDENICDCEIEQTYNSFYKYALGISKYTSSTLTLGELGKFPFSNKASVLGLAYWLRMEQGTEYILLNKAFNSMKMYNWVKRSLAQSPCLIIKEAKNVCNTKVKLYLFAKTSQLCIPGRK